MKKNNLPLFVVFIFHVTKFEGCPEISHNTTFPDTPQDFTLYFQTICRLFQLPLDGVSAAAVKAMRTKLTLGQAYGLNQRLKFAEHQ